METKEQILQKEIDRLLRRNKILTKRIHKLQLENASLLEDLERLETVNYRTNLVKVCPLCASEVESIVLPIGKTLTICSRYPERCSYRELKEN